VTPVTPLESALTKTAGCHPLFLPPIPILEPIPSPIIPVFHGIGDVTPIALSPLAATLIDLPASVANKRLTVLAKLFRCNTYEKHGGGVPVMVNQESDKDHCPERSSGAKIDVSRPCRAANRESLSNWVAAFSYGCYDLVFP
jgi:hypothetical protein